MSKSLWVIHGGLSQDGITSGSGSCTFVSGMRCLRETTCPNLRRRRCLFFLSEDETASASLVGQDQPPDCSVLACLARLERVVEQILAILVPQITKDFATMSQHAPAERVQITTVEPSVPQIMKDAVSCLRPISRRISWTVCGPSHRSASRFSQCPRSRRSGAKTRTDRGCTGAPCHAPGAHL